VTRHHATQKLQFIIGLTLLCVFWAGLQAAYSCPTHAGCTYSPEVRVDRCHIDQKRTPVKLCCQSEACHRSTPLQRDLGIPEYHHSQKSAQLLTEKNIKLNLSQLATIVVEKGVMVINM